MGKPTERVDVGDVEAGFKNAALVLDETFVTPNTSHQCLETRTAMAYWQNGKVYVHTGTQSTAQTVPAIARWLGIEPSDVVFISEYTGGGFGSKITGDITLVIPALLSKKTGAPVMMRITREEEHYIGRARPSLHGRMKVGFTKEGRITGARHVRDLRQRPVRHGGRRVLFRPHRFAALPAAGHALARRHRPDEHAAAQSRKARRAECRESRSWSRCSRKRRASSASIRWRCGASTRRKAKRPFGPLGGAASSNTRPARSSRKRSTAAPSNSNGTSAKLNTGKRSGTKVRGVGVSVSCYSRRLDRASTACSSSSPMAGSTSSPASATWERNPGRDVHRVVAEILGVPWEKCEITWGNTSKNLPWTCPSGGSQTTHAMTRAAHAVAMDAKAEAAANRGQGSRRQARRLRGRQRTRRSAKAAAPA